MRCRCSKGIPLLQVCTIDNIMHYSAFFLPQLFLLHISILLPLQESDDPEAMTKFLMGLAQSNSLATSSFVLPTTG